MLTLTYARTLEEEVADVRSKVQQAAQAETIPEVVSPLREAHQTMVSSYYREKHNPRFLLNILCEKLSETAHSREGKLQPALEAVVQMHETELQPLLQELEVEIPALVNGIMKFNQERCQKAVSALVQQILGNSYSSELAQRYFQLEQYGAEKLDLKINVQNAAGQAQPLSQMINRALIEKAFELFYWNLGNKPEEVLAGESFHQFYQNTLSECVQYARNVSLPEKEWENKVTPLAAKWKAKIEAIRPVLEKRQDGLYAIAEEIAADTMDYEAYRLLFEVAEEVDELKKMASLPPEKKAEREAQWKSYLERRRQNDSIRHILFHEAMGSFAIFSGAYRTVLEENNLPAVLNGLEKRYWKTELVREQC